MLLRDVFDSHDVHYATTLLDLPVRAGIKDATILPDCNRDDVFGSVTCLWQSFALVRRLRPDIVFSTGAAPGFFCILAGRLFGAKTIWLESVANAEQLSMCGSLSVRIANRCLVQWPHLARPDGPHYAGALL